MTNELFRYILKSFDGVLLQSLADFLVSIEYLHLHDAIMRVHYPHETIPVGSQNLDAHGNNSHHLLSIFHVPS